MTPRMDDAPVRLRGPLARARGATGPDAAGRDGDAR